MTTDEIIDTELLKSLVNDLHMINNNRKFDIEFCHKFNNVIDCESCEHEVGRKSCGDVIACETERRLKELLKRIEYHQSRKNSKKDNESVYYCKDYSKVPRISIPEGKVGHSFVFEPPIVDGYFFICSECGSTLWFDENWRTPVFSSEFTEKNSFLYCPGCGAKVIEK